MVNVGDNIDLKTASENLSIRLKKYSDYFRMPFYYDIKKQGMLKATPEGVNSARVVIPVDNGLNMYAILFAPKDGTGNTSYFGDSDSIIPQEYQFEDKSERVFPRNKQIEGTVFEIVLPIGTLGSSGSMHNLVSLEQLTVDFEALDGVTLKKDWNIGMNSNKQYIKALYQSRAMSLQMIPTVWSDLSGKKHGNVHAVYNPTEEHQLVCFLGFNEEQFAKNSLLIKHIQPQLRFPF